ncbi:hypothetical protein SAMN04489712_1077 [Thermomonospora echinospora]|uniref:Uncharacterized protein n=1 Tax=Thermomonospora echinospora TaxID=1992 RepID=A0A1H6BE86_9ACTN|nr:hypothetical protein SAMN04489712_1077 [Thermomonospora echinospora]
MLVHSKTRTARPRSEPAVRVDVRNQVSRTKCAPVALGYE